jgi:hypothetical protein
MLIEDLLWLVLSAVIVRAIWRLVDGVIRYEGPGARPTGRARRVAPVSGVQMARDPVAAHASFRTVRSSD